VHVTDPGRQQYNISSINVTASAVEIHKAGGEGEEGEWISLNITMPTFDLIEIKEGGLEKILASANVAAGNYTQIRVTIEEVKVTLDGETKNAMVPSNELKFARPFDVVDGGTTILTLDFDADKSAKVTGADKVIVTPVVTLAITQAPALSVEITSPEDGAELTESSVTVNGTVSKPKATVAVNDAEVAVAQDGTFSTQVELTEGENTIMVVASLGKQKATASLAITYSPEEET
jgi:hypothetical protein